MYIIIIKADQIGKNGSYNMIILILLLYIYKI